MLAGLATIAAVILGAYFVGILVAGLRHQLPQVRRILETVTAAFFAPIFFVLMGMQVDLATFVDPSTLVLAGGLTVVAVATKVIAGVENHHNFAWRETHVVDGAERELIVHRKGATPAGAGVPMQ